MIFFIGWVLPTNSHEFTADVANLQDLLVHVSKGLSYVNSEAKKKSKKNEEVDKLIIENLFTTLTNTNFDRESFVNRIKETIKLRDELKNKLDKDALGSLQGDLKDAVNYSANSEEEFEEKGQNLGPQATENEDVRSLRELIIYSLKGIAAYAYHANILGYNNEEVDEFLQEAMVKTLDDSLSGDKLTSLALD